MTMIKADIQKNNAKKEKTAYFIWFAKCFIE